MWPVGYTYCMLARWLAGSHLCSVKLYVWDLADCGQLGFTYRILELSWQRVGCRVVVFFFCPGISPFTCVLRRVTSVGLLPRLVSVASVPLINVSSPAVVWAPTLASLPYPCPPVAPSTRPVFILAQPHPSTSGPVPSLALPAQALSLSMSLEPFPPRLVARINAGQFVEMRDLLGDNIILSQRMEEAHTSFPSYILPSSSGPSLREVATLPLWLPSWLSGFQTRQ